MKNVCDLKSCAFFLSRAKSEADKRRKFFPKPLSAIKYYFPEAETVSLFLPLALLAEITDLPVGDDILFKKPCTLNLLPFFGCHVLLLIKHPQYKHSQM